MRRRCRHSRSRSPIVRLLEGETPGAGCARESVFMALMIAKVGVGAITSEVMLQGKKGPVRMAYPEYIWNLIQQFWLRHILRGECFYLDNSVMQVVLYRMLD